MTEKPDAKKTPFTKQVNMSKLDAPIICPLLSMAAPNQEEFTDCAKEACWFYNRALKKCALVHMAISLERLTEGMGKGNLYETMASLKRQHRPE